MSVITQINIKHVKGIDSLEIKCALFPNKPNFIIAPNGTGKSSIATAFSSLRKSRLKLDEADYHNGAEWPDTSIEIVLDNRERYLATAEKNDINTQIDSFVINSGLYANLTNRNTGSRVYSQTKMSIRDRVLYEKIPETVSLEYSIKEQREKFPSYVRKLLYNFDNLLRNEAFVTSILNKPAAFNKTTSGGRYTTAINKFLKLMLDLKGTKEDMLLASVDTSVLANVVPIVEIVDILREHLPENSEAFLFLNAIQVNWYLEGKKALIKKHLEVLEYKQTRKDVDDLLNHVNSTRLPIASHRKSGSLVVSFPDWDEASNGEIDVLQFCASLIEARIRLSKSEKAILLIDEVFDYLDDANLIVAQYYLKKMMDQYRSRGKQLYVTILTHIDPSMFQSYRFKNIHKSYIGIQGRASICGYMANILKDRNRCKIELPLVYQMISSHFLHFSCANSVEKETQDYLKDRGLPKQLAHPAAFAEKMKSSLCAYIDGGPFDIAKVCCGLRIVVEKYAYEQLPQKHLQDSFIEINTGTEDRLQFAENNGVDIPETMHLLGSLYNGCMHISGTNGEEEILFRQLNNTVIKNMIKEVSSFAK